MVNNIAHTHKGNHGGQKAMLKVLKGKNKNKKPQPSILFLTKYLSKMKKKLRDKQKQRSIANRQLERHMHKTIIINQNNGYIMYKNVMCDNNNKRGEIDLYRSRDFVYQ